MMRVLIEACCTVGDEVSSIAEDIIQTDGASIEAALEQANHIIHNNREALRQQISGGVRALATFNPTEYSVRLRLLRPEFCEKSVRVIAVTLNTPTGLASSALETALLAHITETLSDEEIVIEQLVTFSSVSEREGESQWNMRLLAIPWRASSGQPIQRLVS